MKTKFTYPVETSLTLLDRWPLQVGDLTVEWLGEAGCISAVSVVAPVSPLDQLPSYQPNPSPGVSAAINVGYSARTEEVEALLRRVQGLMVPFALLTIDFAHVEFAWLPESEEERAQLPVLAIRRRDTPPEPIVLPTQTFDLLARAVAAAVPAAKYEVAFSFFRRGRNDARAERYIEAFYNLFFFLETLFAPGYSNPEKVKARMKAAPKLISGLAEMRQSLERERSQWALSKEVEQLLALDDNALIDHLVKTRGNLHHHAPGAPAVWHPDQSDRFQAVVEVLGRTIHAISTSLVMPLLFAPERDIALREGAQQAGAVVHFRGVVLGVEVEGQPRTEVLKIPIIGSRVHRAGVHLALAQAKKRVMELFQQLQVTEIRITDAEGSQIYLSYERQLLPS